MPTFAGEEPAGQSNSQEDTSVDSGRESPTESEGLSHEDLEALADQVYDLLLRDLVLEHERGVWR